MPVHVLVPLEHRKVFSAYDAGHGYGRPPDGPPEEGSWAFARGLKSMFGWPQYNAAPPLPPLTSSGLRGLRESGQDDGGVHRPSATQPASTSANACDLGGGQYEGVIVIFIRILRREIAWAPCPITFQS